MASDTPGTASRTPDTAPRTAPGGTAGRTQTGTGPEGAGDDGTAPGAGPVHPELDRTFRVRADAFYVRQQDGVWLGNDTGSFSVRGEGAYQLVSSLFAGLDGEHTLHDLYGNVPEKARRSVLSLVDALLRNGFIKEVSHPAEPVPGWMRDRYATHLAFLEHHADRPVTRLQRVRTRRVLCAGRGTALRALLDALRDFGIAQVDVVADGDPDLAPVLGDTAAQDPGARWRLHGDLGPDGPAALAEHSAVGGADVVLLAYDTACADELAEAQHALWARGHTVGVLARCGGFVAALAPGLRTPWCWECVHRSVAAAAVGGAEGLGPAVAPAAVGALRLAEHAFVRLADVERYDRKPLTTVEPLTPVVRNHVVAQHPLCPRHTPAPHGAALLPDSASVPEDAVRPDVPAPEDPPSRVEVSDRIVAASARLTDPVTGPLLSLGEEDLGQLPLSASACRVADPEGDASAPRDLRLVCRAFSPREARNQAVLFAVEWMAARVALRTGDPAAAELAGYRFGAGWSPAEAHGRARLNAALDAPPGPLDWKPAAAAPPSALPEGGSPPPGSPADGTPGVLRPEEDPLIGFLAGALATEGVPWRETSVESLAGGIVRAHVRTADGAVATGAGHDADRAVGHALARALARCATGGNAEPGTRSAVAFLAPAAAAWTEALKAIEPSEGARDVSALLPFLGGADAPSDGACISVVAVPGPGVTG
ncbi:hypothetical protein [Streptomyces sp. NPDC059165]|uniref:hypothetical protein n=1 Tax=Streptomyces sp. NPDC059165 TaxID=3346751 RepID=UPI0036AF2300